MPSLPPMLGARKPVGPAIGSRKNSFERGYDARWRKARVRFLGANPLCVHCLSTGRTTVAVVVDHITPHRGDQGLFWDEANWQALCVICHNRKSASER